MSEKDYRNFSHPRSNLAFSANIIFLVAFCLTIYNLGSSEQQVNIYIGGAICVGFLINGALGWFFGEMPVSGLVVKRKYNPKLFFVRFSISIILSLCGLMFALFNT